MADFRNTIDVLGDDAVFDSIIKRTVTEFKDDKVTKVRQNTFRECTTLNTVDLPNVTEIGSSAFTNCSSLTSVNCPKATPLASAFNNCSALTSVSFPLATRIGDSVFANCTSLSEINLPKVTAIDGSGFNKTAIDVADFPALTYLGGFSLANSPLTALVLRSQTVATMSNVSALQNTNIARGTGHIYVPTALIEQYRTASGWSTYANQFRKLEEWTVDGTVTGELNIEGRHMVRFFDEDGTLLYYTIVNSGDDAVFVGDEPTKEGDYAFTGWNPVPTNITEDTDCYAQFKFTALVSKTLVERTISGEYINDRVKTVGSAAFRECKNLTSVKLPSVTTCSGGAFRQCSNLTRAEFSVVNFNGYSTFAYCSKLTTLILRGETMSKLAATDSFDSTPIKSGTGYIYVLSALVDSYKSASGWKYLANQIRAIEDYPEICGGEE